MWLSSKPCFQTLILNLGSMNDLRGRLVAGAGGGRVMNPLKSNANFYVYLFFFLKRESRLSSDSQSIPLTPKSEELLLLRP